MMKLRFDLVEEITPEMLMESVLANNHRYKAEPLLSKTVNWQLVTGLNRGCVLTEEKLVHGPNPEMPRQSLP